MADRRQRALRGTLVGAVSVLAAAVGHDLAGGGMPGWLAIVVGLAFALPLGVGLAARRPSLPRTAAVVAISQAAFHYLFIWLGSPGLPTSGHHHGAAALAMTVPTATMDAAAMPAEHLTDPRMLAAHVLAAVVTIALLRRAELAIGRLLVRRLERAAILLAAPRVPEPAAPAIRPADAAPRLRSRLLLATAPRRGPPALSFD